MRTIIPEPYNVYMFDELVPEIQEKVIAKNWEINVDSPHWYEHIIDEDAFNIGLKITEFDLDYRIGIKGHFVSGDYEGCAKAILQNHGEDCPTYKTARAFIDEYNCLDNEHNKDELTDDEFQERRSELADDFLNALLEDYLSLLRKDYNYLTSKEAIRETLIANECEFKEDGSPC